MRGKKIGKSGCSVDDSEAVKLTMRQAQVMQYGVIMVAEIPMLGVYLLIRKQFVKCVKVGAVKG